MSVSVSQSTSASTQRLRTHVREIGKLAEVIGALSNEFERQPRVAILATMKERIAQLAEEWARAEAILSGKNEV